jgi:hypothetical protein
MFSMGYIVTSLSFILLKYIISPMHITCFIQIVSYDLIECLCLMISLAFIMADVYFGSYGCTLPKLYLGCYDRDNAIFGLLWCKTCKTLFQNYEKLMMRAGYFRTVNRVYRGLYPPFTVCEFTVIVRDALSFCCGN